MIKTSLTKNNYVNTKTQVLIWFYYIYSKWWIVDIATVYNACIDSIRLCCWGEAHAASSGEIKTRNTKKLSILR